MTEAQARPRGVRHVVGVGDYDEYRGSKKALISTGIVNSGQFPGDPGRGRTTVTIRPKGANRPTGSTWRAAPGYMKIYRSGPGFRVEVTVSAEEQANRELQRQRQRQRQKQYDLSALRRWQLQPSEREFRIYARRSASQSVASLAHALNACDNPYTPYRYGKAEQGKFRELCMKIVELIETGRIEPRAVAIAQDDVAFQRFVRKSTGTIERS